ncbi:MAG TPA: hypothetical protein VJ777_31780 [Mycobacterium sp.]|nr:hypothetical protein [Mycobacterium sp.]
MSSRSSADQIRRFIGPAKSNVLRTIAHLAKLLERGRIIERGRRNWKAVVSTARSKRILLFAPAVLLGLIMGLGFAFDSIPHEYPPLTEDVYCPFSTDVHFTLSTRVYETNAQLAIDSILEVKMSGVSPPDPNWNILDLNRRNSVSSTDFVSCFLIAPADIEKVTWSNGIIDARFKLKPDIYFSLLPDEDLYNPLPNQRWDRATEPIAIHINLLNKKTSPSGESGNSGTQGNKPPTPHLFIALCSDSFFDEHDSRNDPDQDGLATGMSLALGARQAPRSDISWMGLLCAKQTQTTVKVVIDSFYPAPLVAGEDNAVVAEIRAPQPFPDTALTSDRSVEYTWVFDPYEHEPLLTVPLAIPLRLSAASWIDDTAWFHTLPVIYEADDRKVLIDARYLSYAASALIAAVAAALVLGSGRLLAITAAFAVMGGLRLYVTPAPETEQVERALVAIIAWTVLLTALYPAKLRYMPLILVGAVYPIWRLGASTDFIMSSTFKGIVYLILLVTVTCSVIALWIQLIRLFDLRGDRHDTDYQFRNALHAAGLLAFAFTIAFPIGLTLGAREDTSLDSLLYWTNYSLEQWTYSSLQLVPLIVASLIATEFFSRELACIPRYVPITAALSLLLTLSAPWNEGGSARFIIALPLWIVQWAVMWAAFSRWVPSRDEDVPRCPPIGGPGDDSFLSSNGGPTGRSGWHPILFRWAGRRITTSSSARTGPTIPRTAAIAEATLGAGPTPLSTSPLRDSELDTARTSARMAGYMAVVPVAYFVWTTLGHLMDALSWPDGAITIVVAIVVETARWVVGGFVFGLLFHTILKGAIGPLKGLAFAGVWAMGCVAPAAIARGAEIDLGHQILYRIAQFAVFFIILGVLLDWNTLKKRGNGSWKELRDHYRRDNSGELAIAVAPTVLTVLTLIQQIFAGSPGDVATSFVEGIGSVINPLGGGAHEGNGLDGPR